jgi:hypothetical protein
MNEVHSNESMSCNHRKLLKIVEIFIENERFIKFVREKNKIFSDIYHEHYILNKKSFICKKINESFALSWLMYLYH